MEPTAGTAERVAANVVVLRAERRLTVRALSKRLSQLGHPIVPSSITKIEKGTRQVDVEDLVALALALEVTPNRLLLLPAADDEPVSLGRGVQRGSRSTWEWACGDHPLNLTWGPAGASQLGAEPDRLTEFQEENRPHRLSDDEEALRERVAAAEAAGQRIDDRLSTLEGQLTRLLGRQSHGEEAIGER